MTGFGILLGVPYTPKFMYCKFKKIQFRSKHSVNMVLQIVQLLIMSTLGCMSNDRYD